MYTMPLTPPISKGLLPRSSTFATAIHVIANWKGSTQTKLQRPKIESHGKENHFPQLNSKICD